MSDMNKTKKHLVDELAKARRRIAELQILASECSRVEDALEQRLAQ